MIRKHPAADNVLCLRQGVELIHELEDGIYAGPPVGLHHGVGAQFRHCLDFYACFLRGAAASRVDYALRDRDRRVEVDRSHAIRRFETTIRALSELDPACCEEPLHVRLDPPFDPCEPNYERGWCGSSVGRELQFLLSHTIHHYALVAQMLGARGRALGERFADFGVAPSTPR
jgi:hypothetical protein